MLYYQLSEDSYNLTGYAAYEAKWLAHSKCSKMASYYYDNVLYLFYDNEKYTLILVIEYILSEYLLYSWHPCHGGDIKMRVRHKSYL